MEAQFDPAVIYEFQNIVRGAFKINGISQDSGLEDAVKNQANYRLVDLKPYMNPDGFGKVRLNWRFVEKYRNREGEVRKRREKRSMTVQVTDLGLTTRYAYNRFLGRVNRLSTGEPVEGARVILRGRMGYRRKDVTDAQGLAEIALEPWEFVRGFYNA